MKDLKPGRRVFANEYENEILHFYIPVQNFTHDDDVLLKSLADRRKDLSAFDQFESGFHKCARGSDLQSNHENENPRKE